MANIVDIIAQDLYSESTVKQHPLGTKAEDKYGNRYRYVQAGGSALVTGNLLQEPAEDTQFRSMAVAAAVAIGETTITCTLGSSATTANQFDEGILFVESSTGIGQNFRILSHSVTSASGTATFEVDRPVKIALTTSSQVTVRKNPFDGVIQTPATTATGGPVGIALYAMSASAYGWIQSGGEVSALFDTGGNTASDQMGIEVSLAVAGSVKVSDGTAGDTVIGFAREVVSSDSTHGLVHLTID